MRIYRLNHLFLHKIRLFYAWCRGSMFPMNKSDSNLNSTAIKKRWLMRLLALLLPLTFIFLIEGGLRLFNYGYSSHLFDEIMINDETHLIPNRNYTDRFFPAAMARKALPQPFLKEKPEGSLRIFILGESAAYGDPDSSFGMGRYLEAILETRYPEQDVEVINLAITAINSNVILPLSKELAHYEADAWMLYMGNNEMVGPYGAGTIFGGRAPSTTYIRTILTLKKYRIVQWLEHTFYNIANHSSESKEWGGVNMFAENKLRFDHPAKEQAYQNFERNVGGIFKHAAQKNIPLFASTVASNLKDCSPFISLHREDITAQELEHWKKYYISGKREVKNKNYAEALKKLNEATEYDDTFAELEFMRATCMYELEDHANALMTYKRARDLDALCIRADSRINDILRRQASENSNDNVHFIDMVQEFEGTNFFITGEKHFYEHVHLTMEGNYQIALRFADKIASSLAHYRSHKNRHYVNAEKEKNAVQERLATTLFDQRRIWQLAQWRIDREPYKQQSSHKRNMQYVENRISQIDMYLSSQAYARDEALYLKVLEKYPYDVELRWNYAQFLERSNRLSEAIEQGMIICSYWPTAPYPHYFVGSLLRKEKRYNDADAYLAKALKIDPEFTQAAEEFKLNQLLR